MPECCLGVFLEAPVESTTGGGRIVLLVIFGAGAGSRGELALGPPELPHLWTHGKGMLLTVAGPLSRGELLRVAESLEAR